MPTAYDDNTKKFIESVNALIEKGAVKNRQEITDALEWNKTSMSQVMNGDGPVPKHIFAKFRNVYPDVQPQDLRDQQIQFYKEQVEFYKQIAAEKKALEERLEKFEKVLSDNNRMITEAVQGLAAAKQNQLLSYSLLVAFQEYWLEQAEKTFGGIPAVEAQPIVDKKAFEIREKLMQAGTFA